MVVVVQYESGGVGDRMDDTGNDEIEGILRLVVTGACVLVPPPVLAVVPVVVVVVDEDSECEGS